MSGSPFVSETVIALILISVLLAFIASQFFWILAVRRWGKKVISNRKLRIGLGGLLLVIYAALFFYNFFGLRHQPSPTHLTLSAALLQAPFAWWAMSSLAGFGMVALFWLAGRALRLIRAAYSKVATSLGKARLPVLSSPARRRFLERTAFAASSLPFAACAYGLTIGRTNIETTRKRIRLARLPKAFDGLRVAQLSDLHIGPFMSASQIRHVVQMTNDYKADLVLMTGDYIIWDPSTQGDVVDALSGLRAPFGVVGCLGNHELWAGCEASITQMFAERNIRILRHERWPIQTGGEVLNLIGVDYEAVRHFGPHPEGVVDQYLKGVEPLILPDTANILLSHNPNTFDRAAALGIDLSLAGHTHGGQVTLEFINKNLSPSRLITAYVRGWFEKKGCQLYVNRGIGTIGVPIRFDAPPEITIFELVREA
jgi:predicted MPP superfamily phosphohydrolase